MDTELYEQKLQQANQLLATTDLDAWITFVRETSLQADPALSLIYPYGVTWDTAFIVTSAGDRIAIVGRYDVENAERLGVFDRVLGYDESIEPVLVETLQELAPDRLGVNSSRSDPSADGLTSGMRTRLLEFCAAAGIDSEQVVSAQEFLASLRGRKTPGEVDRIRAAIETTERLYQEVEDRITPGASERELASFLKKRVEDLGLEYAWDPHANPIVNTGPESAIGHAAPSDLQVERGHIVHFDFGIRQDGFCSDLQRVWYVLEEGQHEPPPAVQATWKAVRGALLAGAHALRPGARGWQVDAAAREALQGAGLPDYKHAFGHHIGRVAHDGATILGPRWPRYGDTPEGVIEPGNVFAIELGAKAEAHGWVYLEENVLVEEDGLEWLSQPQEEIWLV
ncbi:MAG: Xaa-Pro peptidase family protein [Anaerolineales bacterium]|nr:Xaa-Pro peptidase family protein [Anaerolineales bacterium]